MLFKKYNIFLKKFISILMVFVIEVGFLPFNRVNAEENANNEITTEESEQDKSVWEKYKGHILSGTGVALMCGSAIVLLVNSKKNKSEQSQYDKRYWINTIGNKSKDLLEDMAENGVNPKKCILSRGSASFLKLDRKYNGEKARLFFYDTCTYKGYEDIIGAFLVNGDMNMFVLDLNEDREKLMEEMNLWFEKVSEIKSNPKFSTGSKNLMLVGAYDKKINDESIIDDIKMNASVNHVVDDFAMIDNDNVFLIDISKGEKSRKELCDKILLNLELLGSH